MKETIKALINRMPYIAAMRRQIEEQGAFPAGHYYSPIPAKRDVATGIKEGSAQVGVSDIDLCENEQSVLIDEFAEYYSDLPFREKQSKNGRYYYDQTWFCYSDAIMLYCMIRKFAFKRIVEIGSGYSSAVMLDTLDALGGEDYKITFIEPYPERLQSLVKIGTDSRLALHQEFLQNVNVDLFHSLEPGDLLFIDSSHVLKYGSDLHFLLFNVLPILKRGVIVHFHDIFYPFEYPSNWLKEGRYWNECYFLRAFLSGNKEWKILLFNDYANQVFSETIKKRMPLCQKNFGGSLYIEKTGEQSGAGNVATRRA